MLPDLANGIDCNKAGDYFSLEGFLSTDAWLILPFLLGMLFYKLRHKVFAGVVSGDLSTEKHSMELSQRNKLGFEGTKTSGYGYSRDVVANSFHA